MRRTNKEQTHAPDGSFTTKLGSTAYNVGIRFSENCNVTLEDKLKKLLAREVNELQSAILE